MGVLPIKFQMGYKSPILLCWLMVRWGETAKGHIATGGLNYACINKEMMRVLRAVAEFIGTRNRTCTLEAPQVKL